MLLHCGKSLSNFSVEYTYCIKWRLLIFAPPLLYCLLKKVAVLTIDTMIKAFNHFAEFEAFRRVNSIGQSKFGLSFNADT